MSTGVRGVMCSLAVAWLAGTHVTYGKTIDKASSQHVNVALMKTKMNGEEQFFIRWRNRTKSPVVVECKILEQKRLSSGEMQECEQTYHKRLYRNNIVFENPVSDRFIKIIGLKAERE